MEWASFLSVCHVKFKTAARLIFFFNPTGSKKVKDKDSQFNIESLSQLLDCSTTKKSVVKKGGGDCKLTPTQWITQENENTAYFGHQQYVSYL